MEKGKGIKMSKSLKRFFILIAVIVVLFVAYDSVIYTTYEDEYVVIKQFGKIQSVSDHAGAGVKIPFIQTTTSIPKSLQFYDLLESDVITSDKKSMIVDAYITWRITDPILFTKTLNANTTTAEGRLDVITYNAIKTTISNMTQEEVIRSRDDNIDIAHAEATEDIEINDISAEDVEAGDATAVSADNKNNIEIIALSERLLECIGNQCDQYGIQIVSVDVKKLDLPEENKEAVYQRMITERNNIAAAYKAQGQSEAQIIKNTTDKEVSVMLSEAQAKADQTIAEGEAQYMSTLSEAYNDEGKADFYLFVRSLDAAKDSLKNKDNTLFLSKDSPIAQIFNGN